MKGNSEDYRKKTIVGMLIAGLGNYPKTGRVSLINKKENMN